MGPLCLQVMGAKADPTVAARVRSLNNDLLGFHGELQRIPRDQADSALREGALAIERRAAALSALIQQDPRQALSLVFSPELLSDLAAKFPESASLLESHGAWQGSLESWIIDYPDGTHRTVHRMRVGDESLQVHFAGPEPAGLKSGDILAVNGVRLGVDVVAAEAATQEATTTVEATTCSTTGVQNTAVLLVNFPGVPLASNITPSNVSDMFFGTSGPSLAGYWSEVSYGKTSVTGNVFGPYTLDSSYNNCSRLDLLRDAAITAAANAGVNFPNYSRIFIVTPDMCGWAGLAINGCTSLNSPTGPFTASASFLNGAWARSQTEGADTAAHEGGHNMGLAHAQLRNFGTEALGPLGAAGTLTEYGDHWSNMSTSNLGHYAAPHKAEILNWISSGTNYQVVQSSGTWTLQPLEINPAGLVALKVQRGTGNNAWLWIEYRQPIGIYDSPIWPASGAVIHYEDSTTGGYTQLVDFTPATAAMTDAALMPGSTWADPYTNVSITVQSATASALTVSVNYGTTPCTHANPTVSVSPPNPNVSAGASVNYTVSVTNNDAAGCAASTFNLGSSQPTGWPTAFSATSVTLSPGQAASVTMTKTVPAGTPPTTAPVDSSAASSTFQGSGTANCTVVALPSLSASLSVAGATFTARQTVSMTAIVLNGGVPVSGASVTFTMTEANGAKTTKTATTDATGKAVWSYRIGTKDPKGPWSAVASASSGSQTATSNSVNFTVQ